jgi:hypothetical protein
MHNTSRVGSLSSQASTSTCCRQVSVPSVTEERQRETVVYVPVRVRRLHGDSFVTGFEMAADKRHQGTR